MRRGEFRVYWFCPSSQLRFSRELLAVLSFFAPVVAASKYPRAASTAPAPMISGQNFLIRIAAGGVLPFRNPNPLSRDRRVPTLIPLPSLTESKRLLAPPDLDNVPNDVLSQPSNSVGQEGGLLWSFAYFRNPSSRSHCSTTVSTTAFLDRKLAFAAFSKASAIDFRIFIDNTTVRVSGGGGNVGFFI